MKIAPFSTYKDEIFYFAANFLIDNEKTATTSLYLSDDVFLRQS